jgi:hypothetical protein
MEKQKIKERLRERATEVRNDAFEVNSQQEPEQEASFEEESKQLESH